MHSVLFFLRLVYGNYYIHAEQFLANVLYSIVYEQL